MPRGLENWLTVGFVLTLAPVILSGCIIASHGSHLAWIAVVVFLYLVVLSLDIVGGSRFGLSAGAGKFVVLVLGLAMLGMGGYDLYQLYGQGQKISPMPDGLVTLGWLCAIGGPFLIFAMLNGRQAKDYFASAK